MTTPADIPTLRVRADDYSLQVSAVEDPRFWFRLERLDGRDVITDFFPGSTPEPSAGRLLRACYRALRIVPQPVVIFRDILPSSGPTARSDDRLAHARDLYTACGEALLLTLGAGEIITRLQEERGKYHLILTAVGLPTQPARGPHF